MLKVMEFDTVEAYEESGVSGEYEILTVVKRKNHICADLITECKRYKTALRRFFKGLEGYPELYEWKDTLEECCENGIFEDVAKYKGQCTGEYHWHIENCGDYFGDCYYIELTIATGEVSFNDDEQLATEEPQLNLWDSLDETAPETVQVDEAAPAPTPAYRAIGEAMPAWAVEEVAPYRPVEELMPVWAVEEITPYRAVGEVMLAWAVEEVAPYRTVEELMPAWAVEKVASYRTVEELTSTYQAVTNAKPLDDSHPLVVAVTPPAIIMLAGKWKPP